jgi:cell division protein FtsB
MKTITKILFFICAFLVVTTFYFYSENKNTNLDIQKIRKENDSLLLVVVNNNKKIDSISNRNEKLFEKNDSLKNKMSVINKKAEKYKKQNEENINYINSLSDNDIAKLFADEFNDK